MRRTRTKLTAEEELSALLDEQELDLIGDELSSVPTFSARRQAVLADRERELTEDPRNFGFVDDDPIDRGFSDQVTVFASYRDSAEIPLDRQLRF